MNNFVNDFPLKDFANEEKQIILTVHKIMGKEGNISFQNQNDSIVFRFHNLKNINYKKIKEVMLCHDKIKNVSIHFNKANTVAVHIKREVTVTDSKRDAFSQKVKKNPLLISRRRRRELNIKNDVLKKCALNFLSKKEFIRKEDKRYLCEIVTRIIKWSLGGKAIHMDLSMLNDEYCFKVSNLSSISYSDLQQLPQVGNWVQNIRIKFEESGKSMLLFDVIRSINYINNSYDNYNTMQLGKRKLIN